MSKGRSVLLATAGLVIALPAHAQQANIPSQPAAATTQDTASNQEDIVVTGTVRPERKIDTSISVSAVSAQTISQINPQSAADLIRFIPGIRSEASGGEGNANISVVACRSRRAARSSSSSRKTASPS